MIYRFKTPILREKCLTFRKKYAKIKTTIKSKKRITVNL